MPNMMEKGTFESLVVVFDVKQAFSNNRVCGKNVIHCLVSAMLQRYLLC